MAKNYKTNSKRFISSQIAPRKEKKTENRETKNEKKKNKIKQTGSWKLKLTQFTTAKSKRKSKKQKKNFFLLKFQFLSFKERNFCFAAA